MINLTLSIWDLYCFKSFFLLRGLGIRSKVQCVAGISCLCVFTSDVLCVQISPEEHLKGSDSVFEMKHSCVEETVYYELNQTRLLDFGGVFVSGLDDDPCHSGLFFVSAVNNTDLILLVFYDFLDFTRNSSNKACQKLKRLESAALSAVISLTSLSAMLNLLEIRWCLDDWHQGIVSSAELNCLQVIYSVQTSDDIFVP